MEKKQVIDQPDGVVRIGASEDDIERRWNALRTQIRQKLKAGDTLTVIERDRLLGLIARKLGIL